jgi:hypothetical protein
MKARDLDEAFNEGTDITSHLDLTAARRPKRDVQRVNVDFPAWMVRPQAASRACAWGRGAGRRRISSPSFVTATDISPWRPR